MDGKGMSLEELEKFKEHHQRHAQIQLVDNQLQIFLKDSEGKIVDLVSLTLNDDMTLHPLQAVDEIITAFQLQTYKSRKMPAMIESKPREETLKEIEYNLMVKFAKARKLLEKIKVPYRLATKLLVEEENRIQQIQSLVFASLIFLYGQSTVEVDESEEYLEEFRQLHNLSASIAVDLTILEEVVKGTIEFSNNMKTVRLKDNNRRSKKH